MVAPGRLPHPGLLWDRPMSFRGRLRVFFTMIVIVPMIALAAVLYRLTGDSETGKADAGTAAGLRVAFSLHDASSAQAEGALRGLAASRGFVDDLTTGGSRAGAALRGVAGQPGVVGVAFQPAGSSQSAHGRELRRHRRRSRSAGRSPGPASGHALPLGHDGPQLRRRAAPADPPARRGPPRRARAGGHEQRRSAGARGCGRLRAPRRGAPRPCGPPSRGGGPRRDRLGL